MHGKVTKEQLLFDLEIEGTIRRNSSRERKDKLLAKRKCIEEYFISKTENNW